MNFSRFILSTILLGTILFFNSCSENQQNADKEKLIVERIEGDVALYKFHFKYGATRMGEVIKAAEKLLEAIENPEIKLTEEMSSLRNTTPCIIHC
jgi:hypothetical protein